MTTLGPVVFRRARYGFQHVAGAGGRAWASSYLTRPAAQLGLMPLYAGEAEEFFAGMTLGEHASPHPEQERWESIAPETPEDIPADAVSRRSRSTASRCGPARGAVRLAEASCGTVSFHEPSPSISAACPRVARSGGQLRPYPAWDRRRGRRPQISSVTFLESLSGQLLARRHLRVASDHAGAPLVRKHREMRHDPRGVAKVPVVLPPRSPPVDLACMNSSVAPVKAGELWGCSSRMAIVNG